MKVNKLNLIGALAALLVCRMCMTGQILNFIQFDDVLGEMFFCLLSAMLGIGLLITSFEKESK
jgi:cytochrome c biogenesis protein ResB